MVVVGFIVGLIGEGNVLERYKVKNTVNDYLMEKGYKESDIKEKEVVMLHKGNMREKEFYKSVYKVQFRDEPGVMYYYGVRKEDKEVVQFCEKLQKKDRGTMLDKGKTKHSEEHCV